MNFTLLPDQRLAKGMERLSVTYSAFDLRGSRKISGNVAMPKTVMATIANYVHSEKEIDMDKQRKMVERFGATVQ